MLANRFRRIVLLLLTLCVLATAAALCAPAGAVGTLPKKNTALRHQLCTALSDDAKAYYTGDYTYEKLSALSGAKDVCDSDTAAQDNELYDALHMLMAGTHTYYSSYSGYNSGSLAYFWACTDAAGDMDSYIMFYSDIPSGEDVKLNREHIWPKSRASFNQKGGGADLHHLRPSVDSVNAAKSDHAFGNIFGTYTSGYTEGKLNDTVVYYVHKGSDLFEPKDDVKGDVARILLYVYCRWEQPNLYSTVDAEHLPPMDSDDKQNNGQPVIESLDTLLSWCALDPVDTWEMARNDLVEEVQGNRNVFIDYPELAWQMFGQKLPDDMATPSNAGGLHQSFLGDVDTDGIVTILDATVIQRVLAELPVSAYDAAAADTDEDSEVTILDATAIQRWLASLPTEHPIGEPI